MVFSDLFFLFVFLPAFLLCYLLSAALDHKVLAPLKKAEKSFGVRNLCLVFFSLLFYAWGEPVYVFLMLAAVGMNYLIGRGINSADSGRRKAWLAVGLTGNLLILGTFKYTGFLVAQLLHLGVPVQDPGIMLPIGISFYTFQSISYLMDVYRRESPVQKRFVNLLLYISMFPQLIAGPIVRYDTVAREINDRHVTAQDFSDGLFRFLLGLGKKVILANQLSEISSQFLTDGLQHMTTAGAWIGIVAYTLQIYFDFSGYSDMAIGMGRCMGFHFNENFNHPYISRSITEFWRRWHISLGSFFRDYVYIPMGGNRRHQALNILMVWFLTGLWHGASWNFVLWGLYFGVIVALEKFTILKLKHKAWRPLLHVYSLALIVLGWGIFYYDDFGQMEQFFSSLFGQRGELVNFAATSALHDKFWLWIAALLLCLPVHTIGAKLIAKCCGRHTHAEQYMICLVRMVLSMVILVLSVALLVGATNNAFIYTRF